MVKINLSILVFCPTIYLATLNMYKKFEDSGSQWSQEICNRKSDWRERIIKEMVSIRMLILSYTMRQVIPIICTKFQNLRCSCSWALFDTNFPMYYNGVRDGKNEKQEKINVLFSVPQYTWPLSMCIQNLKSGSHRSWEICNRKFDWRERKIKEMVSIRRLILSYTMQQVIPNICTKFQNPRSSCSWEIFDTNYLMYYIGVRDGKKQKWKNEKRRQKLISASWFSFPNILGHSQGVYKIWWLWLS